MVFIGCKSNKKNSENDTTINSSEQKFDSVILNNIERFQDYKKQDSLKSNEKKYTVKNWNVIGTEPFWNIEIEDNVALFTMLSEQIDSVYFVKTTEELDENKINFYFIDKFKNNANLILTKTPCSDGMSDKQFQYSAVFSYKKLRLNGCAEKK